MHNGLTRRSSGAVRRLSELNQLSSTIILCSSFVFEPSALELAAFLHNEVQNEYPHALFTSEILIIPMATPKTLCEFVDRLTSIRTSQSPSEIILLREWLQKTDLNSMKSELLSLLDLLAAVLKGKTRVYLVPNPDTYITRSSWDYCREAIETKLKVVDLSDEDDVKTLKDKIAQVTGIQTHDLILSVVKDYNVHVLEKGSVVQQLPQEDCEVKVAPLTMTAGSVTDRKKVQSTGRNIRVHLKRHTVYILGSNGKTMYMDAPHDYTSSLVPSMNVFRAPGHAYFENPKVEIPATGDLPAKALPLKNIYAFLSQHGWPELIADMPFE